MLNERLRQARLISGMTQGDVVTRLSSQGIRLTKAGLSKYDKGGSVPPAHVLMKLANVLSVSTDYLFRDPHANMEWIAYRKHANLRKKQREQIQAYAARIVEGQIWLQEKLCPAAQRSFPQPIPVTNPEEAERAATALRKHWKFDELPIENLTNLIEDNGGIVVEYPHEHVEFHGLSGWVNEKYPVTVVNGTASSDRKRFSLGHELGHLNDGFQHRRRQNGRISCASVCNRFYCTTGRSL